jgi:uncharacterized protein (DUF433 family)
MYTVIDSSVCHCQPTFRGTRVLVKDVLDPVATGMTWEAIMEEWHGRILREATAGAVALADKVPGSGYRI